jgi:GNAT superfamily N-acetyltransferase
MSFTLRIATAVDVPILESLIARSIRALGATDYSPRQIDAALLGAFGVDTQLIRDASYYVIEIDGGVVACGGWSRRRTLFGGDSRAGRDAALLDPRVDAAKIRAFFVDPRCARRGLGSLLLEFCESQAEAAGFLRCELMATLPGVRLYAARGYVAGEAIRFPLGPGLDIEFVPMTKALLRAPPPAASP